ncbi:MAG TPA: hypothetical protein VGA37_02530 [Gemmatimonadales bacterium]
MSIIRIRAVREPLAAPLIARKAVATIARADAMGLLPADEVVETLEIETLRRLAGHLRKAGVAPAALAELAAWQGRDVARLAAILDELDEALAHSPVPEHEWGEVVRVLGEERLAEFLHISPSSLRRYGAGARTTPDEVAARLHHLALVIGNLAGTYNEIGVRRWFGRKRSQLKSRTPAELLHAAWAPEDAGPQRVLALSATLLASPAT